MRCLPRRCGLRGHTRRIRLSLDDATHTHPGIIKERYALNGSTCPRILDDYIRCLVGDTCLPVCEETPWTTTLITGQHNLRTFLRIPAGYMRFVPTNQQADIPSAFMTPVRWHADLIMISNETSRSAYMDIERVRAILAHAIQMACGLSPAQIILFSAANPPRAV